MKIEQAMAVWNSGVSVEEAVARYGSEMADFFADFEQAVGCRSFTVHELLSGHIGAVASPKELSEEYARWKGIIGPGKLLREIISQG